jgi:NAD(P)-dependent dehydrogenase (short-subunit alcohol dehydrogenase family)
VTLSGECQPRAGLLTGRTAIFTGAASGIGAATARRFAAEGAKVFVTDLDGDRAAAVAAEISADGGDAWATGLDVTDEAAVENVVAAARSAMGGIGIAVANAGMAFISTLAETSASEVERTLRVNLIGAHNLFRASLPAVRETGDGVLLATESLASSHGSAGLSAYSASKFALAGLVQSVAQEEASHGVRVCSVSPGFIKTGLMPVLQDGGGYETAADLEKDLGAKVALGRMGSPEEVADAFVFLASPLARYITGANLAVDGGYRH